MNKTLAYHQILCDYIDSHQLLEFADDGIFEYLSEEMSVIDVCKRANSDGTWSVCLIHIIKGAPFCRVYRPIYERLNSAMANILLDYARKAYQLRSRNIDNNKLLPQN